VARLQTALFFWLLKILFDDKAGVAPTIPKNNFDRFAVIKQIVNLIPHAANTKTAFLAAEVPADVTGTGDQCTVPGVKC
jgi:hypothetical protein